MKTRDKIEYLRKMLGLLSSFRWGLCTCIECALSTTEYEEYEELKKYVLALHARGLNRYGYLKGVPDPDTDRGNAHRKNLLKKAIAALEAELEASKERPKRVTKKKAVKR